jgi:acetyl esterase/lipase
MSLLQTIHDLSSLPHYWYRSARSRRRMQVSRRRIPYGPHARQYILLLEPRAALPTDELPWAIYFHGGAWTFGTPEAFSAAARPWLEDGFRVALPSYRRPPGVRLPEIVGDCHAAVAELADFARRTSRPLSAPQLAGISAGGHLAGLLALQPDYWTRTGWPASPDRALLCAAPLDLRLLSPRKIFQRYRSINPTELPLSYPSPAFFLLHGTHDGMVNYTHATTFARAIRSRGGQLHLEAIPGGGHLDAGRWTYDDTDPLAPLVRRFIRSGAPVLPAAG